MASGRGAEGSARGATSREQILHALRRNPGLSQISLVRQLALGQATVSVAVGELLSQGLLVSIGSERSTGGRRAERLALNPDGPLMLGLDLGEADAQLGLVNLEGRLIEVDRVRFRRERRRVLLDPLIDAARELAKSRPDVVGVGIAVPGIVDSAAGVVRNAANLGWRDLPVKEAFKTALGLPVVIDRNANAALLGEEWWGSIVGDPFIFITLGSGVGAGMRINGSFVHGAGATAGEFGHLTVERDGLRCRCGRRGCLETRVSGGALVESYKRLVKDSARGRGKGDMRSVAQIAAAAVAGDATARQAVIEVADWLAEGLVTLITLLNPRVLMLGGELMAAQDILLPHIRQAVGKAGPRAARQVVDIVPSTFGDQAVVIGASALAFDRVFRTC